MALQVRRGTNAERIAITPLEGELVFTTDTKQLYVGDGATAGGITSISNTINALLDDTSPQLGGELDLNGNSITGIGSINITGTINASGNINLGDGIGSDIVVFGGAIQGHLVPDTDTTWNLGAPTKQFNEAWISQLNVENQLTVGRIQGDLIADDSTVVFDSSTGLVAAAQLTGTLPAGVIPAAMSSNITGNLIGNVTGNAAGDHTGTFNGAVTATGTLDGDLTGSVFADDSSVLIDGPDAKIVGNILNVSTVSQTLEMRKAGDQPILKLVSAVNNGAFGTPILTIHNHHVGNSAQEIGFQRSNGTEDVPTSNVANDVLGTMTYTSHDGNSYQTSAVMSVIAPAVTGTDDQTSKFVFNTRSGSISTLGVAMEINEDKGVVVTGYMQFGSYTTTERNAITAANGMVIYNTTDNKFQGYESGAWVNLI